MIDLLRQPWPWYVAGALIGLTVPLLLLLGNKAFGLSSSLRHVCAACVPASVEFFNYDWRAQAWNLWFVGGIVVGGAIGGLLLTDPAAVVIAPDTLAALSALGVRDFTSGLLPADVFSWSAMTTARGWFFTAGGGFLVGFGTRYAAGCTSGHAIMGLSNLQWPSLVATLCFMGSGILMTHFGLPWIFSLFA
jgi:hypothetical protein